jgi:hypothetical protein
MDNLEQRVTALKTLIRTPGAQIRDWRFEQEIDELLGVFYDDIGTIKLLPLRSLFDLFLLKVMYVGRDARDPDVLDYLSDMMNRFLLSRELMRFNAQYDFLFSLLDEVKEKSRFQNLFETTRHMADNALFVTGIFPTAGRRRRGWGRMPRFDREHFIDLGRRYYQVAAEEELAGIVGQREVLSKLATGFRFYVETLNEVSQRYVLGFDMELMSNKMLDAYNTYRRTGEQKYLDSASKYAALLKIDRSFSGLRRPRGRVIDFGQSN